MGKLKKIIYLFLFFFFLSSLTRNIIEYRKNFAFYEGYKQTYEEEKDKNNRLKTLQVKTADAHELEKTLRNKLNLTKQNESIVIINVPSPTPTIILPTTPPNYQQWMQTFFQN